MSTDERQMLPENFQPSERDVICGRGKKCYNHDGNISLRQQVIARMHEYSQTEMKLRKSGIISSVVEQVRRASPDGGFVKQDKSGRWYKVGDLQAREKVSQVFRDELHGYKSSKSTKIMLRQERRAKRASGTTNEAAPEFNNLESSLESRNESSFFSASAIPRHGFHPHFISKHSRKEIPAVRASYPRIERGAKTMRSTLSAPSLRRSAPSLRRSRFNRNHELERCSDISQKMADSPFQMENLTTTGVEESSQLSNPSSSDRNELHRSGNHVRSRRLPPGPSLTIFDMKNDPTPQVFENTKLGKNSNPENRIHPLPSELETPSTKLGYMTAEEIEESSQLRRLPEEIIESPRRTDKDPKRSVVGNLEPTNLDLKYAAAKSE